MVILPPGDSKGTKGRIRPAMLAIRTPQNWPGQDSNLKSPAYEAGELPLLHPAIISNTQRQPTQPNVSHRRTHLPNQSNPVTHPEINPRNTPRHHHHFRNPFTLAHRLSLSHNPTFAKIFHQVYNNTPTTKQPQQNSAKIQKYTHEATPDLHMCNSRY